MDALPAAPVDGTSSGSYLVNGTGVVYDESSVTVSLHTNDVFGCALLLLEHPTVLRLLFHDGFYGWFTSKTMMTPCDLLCSSWRVVIQGTK